MPDGDWGGGPFPAVTCVRPVFGGGGSANPEVPLLDEVHDRELGQRTDAHVPRVLGGGVVLAAGHDLAVLEHLRDCAILLVDGRIAADGPFDQVVGRGIDGRRATTWTFT